MIDYEQIITRLILPKLAYHGFKPDKENWYPPQGHYFFCRKYWGATQRISICLIEYGFDEAKAVISRGEDFPTEVPRVLLLNRDAGARLWLSNKYLTAVLQSESRTKSLIPELQGCRNKENEMSARLPTWWRFDGEQDFRHTLNLILGLIISDGLDWFEQQVSEIKRHTEKLEERRHRRKRT